MTSADVLQVFEIYAHKEYVNTMQWILEQGFKLEQHSIN